MMMILFYLFFNNWGYSLIEANEIGLFIPTVRLQIVQHFTGFISLWAHISVFDQYEYIESKTSVELISLKHPTGLHSWCAGMATVYWYSVSRPSQLSKPKPTFNLQPKWGELCVKRVILLL